MINSRKAVWAAPVVVAAAIGAIIAYAGPATASPDLPSVTPEQLIANVAGADVTAFSGNVTVKSNIGLPDLSSLESIFGMQANGLVSLLTGTTNVKVAVDPKVGARAEIDSGTSAYVAVANESSGDAWLYSSASNSATHITGASAPSDTATATVPTPQTIADQAISAITPSTSLSVAANTTVAGRPAYTLVLKPSDAGSVISEVDLFVDATTWFPLGAQVWSTQSSAAALDVAFTSITYNAPAASLFSFTPPSGTAIQNMDMSGSDKTGTATSGQTQPASPTTKVVAGQGWASVVEISGLPSQITDALADPSTLASSLSQSSGSGHGRGGMGNMGSLNQLIGSLVQQTAQGTLYSTYLGALLVTPSGHVFAGAVPASAVQAAAQANP